MEKSILFASSFFIMALLWIAKSKEQNEKVYVCDNKTITVYHHDQNCSELKKCTHNIIEIRQDSAKAEGMALCNLEQ